ncbi:MAG: hypothetical protein JRE64_16080 [Deltaproteobacteria bacterium]|nr:hypothetical protein [Deltaproteobacteria bacterium]
MESTDLTRIFAVVTLLTLIIYADPGTTGGGSARAAEDTALVNLPVEEIADEFKKVRGIKGHFDGGAWNDETDKWMGRKHRLMIELGLRLAGGNYEKSDIIKLLDQPDRIVGKDDHLFEQIVNQKQCYLSTAASYEFLVYYWRGRHDFLFFTCQDGVIINSGWWYAGE